MKHWVPYLNKEEQSFLETDFLYFTVFTTIPACLFCFLPLRPRRRYVFNFG